jgi:hypothetical protein
MKVENEKVVSLSLSELISHLTKQLNARVEKFNSNNGWGFGGAIGERYHLKNITVTIATACYRHTGTTPFIRVDHNGKYGVIDTDRSAKHLANVYNFINENI